MPQNVEIKAKLTEAQFETAAETARQISTAPAQSLFQVDTFFDVAHGRLKLRQFLDPQTGKENAAAELIQYERPDQPGPKLSSYRRIELIGSHVAELPDALQESLGIGGIVKKRRQVFFVNQTRVHLDEVEDLGHFLELEVVLESGQTADWGAEIARQLMEKLGVEDSSLVSGAYFDLLRQAKEAR